MEATFVDPQAVADALAQVRSDTSPVNWMGVTYESTRGQTLKLLGKGEDGADGLASHLTPEMVAFCIVRLVDKIDESATVKFAYVLYLGEQVPRMQRAKLSVHQNAVRAYLGQAHVDFTCAQPGELSTETLLARVMEVSGTASRVLNDSGSREGDDKVRATASAMPHAAGRTSTQAGVPEELDLDEAAREALAAVRSDSDPTTWASLDYDGRSLRLASRGAEPTIAEGLSRALSPAAVSYALVRKSETIDESVTTKFALVTWLGCDVPRMLRARLSAHAARIDALLKPYHVVVHCERADEVSDAAVESAIAKASGRANYVLEGAAAHEAQQQAQAQHHGAAPPAVAQAAAETRTWQRRTTGTPAKSSPPADRKAEDKDALVFGAGCAEAVRDVRLDAGDARKTWAFVGLRAAGRKPTAELLGSGTSEGVDELRGVLAPDVAAWGIVRRTLRVDDSDTTKFLFVSWVGPDVARMLRARLGTWSGAVKEFFAPYHADLAATSLDELTEDAVRSVIETAAGRKDHVLA
eukprot:m51a1_g9800 hypothetical protein (525) ;mRNA; r:1789856-1792541